MKTKITLIADEGKILTDGTHYGRVIYLAAGADAGAYREIDAAEYARICAEREAEVPT